MIRGRVVVVFVLVMLLLTGSIFWFYRRSLVNFIDASGPRFTGEYAPERSSFDGHVKVVSWNIRFGEKIEAAIEELRNVEVLQDTDVLLLQEMDEEGVEQIARELQYNYVYYPASIHSKHGRPFGNAVLSKWPIAKTVKIVLPHASPSNQQRRIAVGALLDVGNTQIMAYSVHTETPALSGTKRNEQVDHLGQRITVEGHRCVVVGGDFNTISSGSVRALEERMQALGLSPVTEHRQPTARKVFLGFTLDHLFVSGLAPLAAGVWSETTASDHYPVWAVLEGCGGG